MIVAKATEEPKPNHLTHAGENRQYGRRQDLSPVRYVIMAAAGRVCMAKSKTGSGSIPGTSTRQASAIMVLHIIPTMNKDHERTDSSPSFCVTKK